MHSQLQIKLHERSLDCLEMITDAKKRIENARHDLYIYDKSTNPFSVIRLMYNRENLIARVRTNEAIRDRLVMWYADIMQRLFEAAMTKPRVKESIVDVAINHFEKEYAF